VKKLLCILLTIFSFTAFSQVVINEFSTSNNGYDDGSGDTNSDWIELFNNAATPTNIGTYYLSDNISNPTKWQIPAGTIIPANGFLVVFATGRNITTGTPLHTNFKINQSSQEEVVFADPSGVVIDMYQITFSTLNGHSRGRSTNGALTWSVFSTSTPDASNNTQTAFNGYLPSPFFSLTAGFYSGTQTLTITNTDPNIQIRYTTNGQEPIPSSTLYNNNPINISVTTVVKAKAFPVSGAFLPSQTFTNTYLINATHSMAVVSCTGDYNGLLNQWPGGPGINTTFEYFDKNNIFQFETTGDMRPHGNDSWNYNTDNKGMRFHAQDEYGGGGDIDYPLFSTSAREKFPVVILKTGASDNYPYGTTNAGWVSTHLRDVFAQTLAEKNNLNLDVRRYEPCVLYLNGQYWGVYEIRERVDADYAEFYYNVEEENLNMIRFWGGTILDAGSDADWCALNTYMNNNSLSIQANYDYVAQRFDISSFIDYFIYNTFIMNNDWLNWNTHWWNANGAPAVKWRYALWDQDNIMGCGGPQYTGIGGTTNENPCEVSNLFSGAGCSIAHTQMFNRLMQNQSFFQQYINRYSQLNNSLMDCDKTIHHLDSLVNLISPEMPRHIQRWGGNINQWNNNLQRMRDTISARCTIIDTLLVDCYAPQISGPFNLTVIESLDTNSTVVYNNITFVDTTWTGTYFGGLTTTISAIGNDPCFVFDYWQTTNGIILPDIYSPFATYSMTGNDTLKPIFKNVFKQLRDTSVCKGENVNILTYNLPVAPEWYVLNNPNLLQVANTYQTVASDTTKYLLKIGSCSDTLTLFVKPVPEFDFGISEIKKCDNDSFIVQVQYPNAVWLWNTGEMVPSKIIKETGTYILKATKDNCSFSDTLVAEFIVAPTLELGNDTIICRGDKIEVVALGDYLNLKWNDNDTLYSKLISKPGNYFAVAKNELCNTTDSINIKEKLCLPCGVYFPNTFTPNFDNLNDVFKPTFGTCNIINYELKIFDRIGTLVFQSTDLDDYWDGIDYKEGGYAFAVTYTIKYRSTSENYLKNGHVYLTR
jgi:gliding motility-associated-like protein